MKDKRARRGNRITLMVISNVLAAIVDSMREADVPNEVIHGFLDSFDRMNDLTVGGTTHLLMSEFVVILRATVPGND